MHFTGILLISIRNPLRADKSWLNSFLNWAFTQKKTVYCIGWVITNILYRHLIWDFCKSLVNMSNGHSLALFFEGPSPPVGVTQVWCCCTCCFLIWSTTSNSRSPARLRAPTPELNHGGIGYRVVAVLGRFPGEAASETLAARCLVKAEKRGAAQKWETQCTIFPGAGASL